YGMISRYGVVAMGSSTDVIGVFTSDAADSELVLSVLAGQDDKDGTTLPDFFAPTEKPEKLTVGVVKEMMTDDVDEEVKARTNDYIKKLQAQGHTIREVSLPMATYSLAMYYIIVSAEV